MRLISFLPSERTKEKIAQNHQLKERNRCKTRNENCTIELIDTGKHTLINISIMDIIHVLIRPTSAVSNQFLHPMWGESTPTKAPQNQPPVNP
mmetsp:Transcript_16398/g.34656  ORF Transcript_16398/g.34656 Transcript_16398/m.34656 type:complete len:93 (-) Transcript_16398:163-441(-)